MADVPTLPGLSESRGSLGQVSDPSACRAIKAWQGSHPPRSPSGAAAPRSSVCCFWCRAAASCCPGCNRTVRPKLHAAPTSHRATAPPRQSGKLTKHRKWWRPLARGPDLAASSWLLLRSAGRHAPCMPPWATEFRHARRTAPAHLFFFRETHVMYFRKQKARQQNTLLKKKKNVSSTVL